MTERSFLGELVSRLGRSDIFFQAGGLAFNILVAVLPILLFVIGLAGFFLREHVEAITEHVVDFLLFFLPPAEGVTFALGEGVRTLLSAIVSERTGFSIIGAIALLWISTRVIGGLRTVLGEVFEIGYNRGIIVGKLFDLVVMFLAGILLLLNVGATFLVGMLTSIESGFLGLNGTIIHLIPVLAGQLLSLASAWVLFLLLYRFIPARFVPFRPAAVGATFTAIAYEVLKGAFAWYSTSFANYSNVYGSLAVAAALFFWIYYSAVVFILGGQVARTYEVRRWRRMEIEGTEKKSGGAAGAGGAALLLLGALLIPAAVSAQGLAPFGGNGKVPGYLNSGEGVVFASAALDRSLSLDRPLVEHDGPYIVVHLAENRVLLLEGTEVVWSAPAGTGHGFQLEGQGQAWTFTTPIGMFHVLRKEKDPVWIAPDWYYVQRNLAIPRRPQDRARIPGTLGTSALFLGDGIAIHGTDQPALLLAADPDDRRVSHGCIRLTNEAARELFHRVDVGTPVLIF